MKAITLALALVVSTAQANWSRADLEKQAGIAAAKHGVPAEALKAICTRESNWNPTALGRAGEVGLCQIRPTTVLMMYGAEWRTDLSEKDRLYLIERELYSPIRNLHLAALYLRWMLREADGDITLAIAGYNAGPGAIRYVRRVQLTMRDYQ